MRTCFTGTRSSCVHRRQSDQRIKKCPFYVLPAYIINTRIRTSPLCVLAHVPCESMEPVHKICAFHYRIYVVEVFETNSPAIASDEEPERSDMRYILYL